MTTELKKLKKWINNIASIIYHNAEPDPQAYSPFFEEPNFALRLVDIIEDLNDDEGDDEQAYYSACIFALNICISQLQFGQENDNKAARKTINQLMSKIAHAMGRGKQSLSFWLPILNAFYEVDVELSEELKDAYLDLAGHGEDVSANEEVDRLTPIREMIEELSDLSVFDIAETFFAQTHAMPIDYLADLILDLYSIEEGQDIALLALLHPKQKVRDIVIATFEHLSDKITLSPISLSRLQVIKTWYPTRYHAQFNRWIKIQRKKEVVFSAEGEKQVICIKASEVDGNGGQKIFIQVKKNKKNRICSLLLKQEIGIKDAWTTSELSNKEVAHYYDEALEHNLILREVDLSYFQMMAEHFLDLTIQHNAIPGLRLLEIQELTGFHLQPKALNIPHLVEELSVQIVPFTPSVMQSSLQRSKTWSKNKSFTETWYVENAHVDKLVNRYCSFVEGVKICALEEARSAVFEQEFEAKRDKWFFHFLWMAFWARSKARKNEKTWQDCFFIAYAIYLGQPLVSIPIMHEICQQTVINSIETMQDRRTYLNRE